MAKARKRNQAAIRRLADFLEAGKFAFDMAEGNAVPACGSAGCIGGHAAVIWPSVRLGTDPSGSFTFDDDALAKRLGVTYETVDELCYPYSPGRSMAEITRKAAVATLRNLARTGKVKHTYPRRRAPTQ